jgi:predicted amidohydrolase
VSVAAIAPREDLFVTIYDVNPGTLMPGTAAQRAEAGARFAPIADDLVTRSARAAQDGARIIAWGESAAPVLEEDVPALVARAATLARQHGSYVQVGVLVFRKTDRYPFMEIRAILLDPTGATVWDYHKAHPTPGENMMVVAGPRVVPVVTTPYGRLATVICYDADFPGLVRQAARPAPICSCRPSCELQRQHARMATFRAIEAGLGCCARRAAASRGGRSRRPGAGADRRLRRWRANDDGRDCLARHTHALHPLRRLVRLSVRQWTRGARRLGAGPPIRCRRDGTAGRWALTDQGAPVTVRPRMRDPAGGHGRANRNATTTISA